MRRRGSTLQLAPLLLALVFASPASASEVQAPIWTVTAVSAPTNFTPGEESGDDVYKVLVENTGGAESDGTPVTITDTLPEGLTLDPTHAKGYELTGHTEDRVNGVPLRCVGLTCTFSGRVIPEETLLVTIPVDVSATAVPSCEVPTTAVSCVTNVVRVSGGGAPDATIETPTVISREQAPFGIAAGSATTSLSSSQAGAHTDLTSTAGFNTIDRVGKLAGAPKEIVYDLSPGFAGDLIDTPACPIGVFGRNQCPIGAQIGVQTITVSSGGREEALSSAVYNLIPDPGDVAKLGFHFFGGDIGIQGDVTVRPPDNAAGAYGLQTRFQNIDQGIVELDSESLTVWGVPTATIHDPWRSNASTGGSSTGFEFGASSTNPLVPYLSNPTSCTGEPVRATLSASSWQEPQAQPATTQMEFGPFVGCDRLGLPATFTAVPTTQEAYAPTGLDAELGVHQTYGNAEGLASSHLNRAVVTLPEGMTVNPSAGAGLGSCDEAQYGEEGVREFSPEERAQGHGCPNESKLGSVRIVAPAISEEALGSVYLAEPAPRGEAGKNPFGSLLALYVLARIPNRGVVVKSAGKVEANPVTGRLTTVFENLPQLPFTTFTLSFRQGETSPLVSPPACGSFTATAELTPWSNLGEVVNVDSPPFEIVHGFGGGACPAAGVPPFAPRVPAGMQGAHAGAYSPFYIRIIRDDGEQEITGFASQLPPGLTANLTGVPFCSEADIALARTKTGAREEAEPSCPAASEIGHTLVGAGVGQVLAYAPGKIYMAGPMPPQGPNQPGAPFSVVAITSAHVGPFDLGTVVVHLPLEINPITAAVRIPAGQADQIPHIIDGIVIHVRDIRVYIDRPNFTLNPTSCKLMGFSATVIGSGQSFNDPEDEDPVTVGDPFQVTDCATLKFEPKFSVSTSGHTSRSQGASLTAKLSYPNTPQGTQANIAQVKVDLPKQLPSRLTTLQKACPAKTFEANPAGCPAASIVGHGKAITPLIPVPLEGPAYFVSYGGAKFPELVIVLQGYGVTLDLHGETFISKAGITSSTFHTIPDQPVGSFELTLPQGKNSALAANGDLCKSVLKMPTAFVAQNGAEIHESTPIRVIGCPPTRAKHKAKKKAKAKGKQRKGKKK
jgi:uncharacterized repeat protein (TIGR01451 family)